MGWLGSETGVIASFYIIPPRGSIRVRIRTPRRGSVRVRTPSRGGGGYLRREVFSVGGCLRGGSCLQRVIS